MKFSQRKTIKQLDEIVALLSASAMTHKELCAKIGMDSRHLYSYIGQLRNQRRAYIAEYRTLQGKRQHHHPVYRAGDCDDAPTPSRLAREIYDARYLAKKLSQVELVVKTAAPEIQPFRDPMLFLFRKAA